MDYGMETGTSKKTRASPFRSKYITIFIFLVLAGLILLYTALSFKLCPEIHSAPQYLAVRDPPLPPHSQNHSYCSFWGPELSSEEALEQRSLLNSIKWPEPPLFSTLHLKETSDPAHSWFIILPAVGGVERHVGDQLDVRIQMNDFQGRPKRYGGDVLFARLHNRKLVAGMVAQVVDHLNGSYSCVFPLLWEGSAQVEVTLLHPSEAVTVLLRTKRQQPDRLFYKSQFRSGSVSETTVCNICLTSNQQPLCNYTDRNTGEHYYCYKPTKLSCDKRFDNTAGGLKRSVATREDALLFKSGVNLKVHIRASKSDSVNVLPKKQDEPKEMPGPMKAMPSGYYYQDVWQALGGDPVRQFLNSSAIIQCLKNKQVHMYGDSTARQWFEYINTTLPELTEVLHSPVKLGPYEAVNITHNVRVTFRCHGPPITFNVPTSVLRYVANELDRLVGGANTVVVLSIWAHFTPFPMEIYINRLRNIRSSVLRLLDRAPGTLVVIRMGNPRAQAYDHTLSYSDWYALQENRVLRAMFKGLNVRMVDAWEMSLAHHLPHDIHPGLPIIRNMINVLLSYIC